jgi:hypothetical protein
MCCFSQPVEQVFDTNIFARSVNGRQLLVYGMAYVAAADLAMVLPLPVPPNPPEDAVRFINLVRYPAFFDDLSHGFPKMTAGSFLSFEMGGRAGVPVLRVHDVGSFEASFVPRVEDFERLDERFRIPREVWDLLPAYRDYGFAVFKLKGSASPPPAGVLRRLLGGAPAGRPPKPRRVHPMAFEFPRRNPDLLYFPTVHVHDRKVHPDAMFDHMLYCQSDPAIEEYLQDWEWSNRRASEFVDIGRAEGIVTPNHYCQRRPLAGRLENKDSLVGNGGSVPEHSAV